MGAPRPWVPWTGKPPAPARRRLAGSYTPGEASFAAAADPAYGHLVDRLASFDGFCESTPRSWREVVERSMRGVLHDLVNLSPVKRMLTGQRWLVRRFFDWKYRREDPYGSRSPGCREKFDHCFSLVADLRCERAVEVGCGEGGNAERIAGFSGSYLGLDISPRAIRRARESVRAPSAEFRVFDLVGDDFDGRHDYLFCSEVLYYLLLEQLPGAVSKIVEATRSGGVIHLLHCRSIRDDSSGMALKEFGAKTVHEAFLRCGALVRLADEETAEYRVTVLQKA